MSTARHESASNRRPTVSVLVPVYNRADLLRECLDSILAQTYGDFEVVVVDGASTDGTWDVCTEYARRDPRVRVVREEVNGGPVAGWQRCLDEAVGSYATFLWSDDLFLPRFLETCVKELTPDVAFVQTAALIGTQPDTGTVNYVGLRRATAASQFLRRALEGTQDVPVSPACALFRLADLRAAITCELPTDPPTDLRWTGAGTDLMFYLATARQYPSVIRIPEAQVFFRAHSGSITLGPASERVALHYALARAWFAQRMGLTRLSNAILARHWLAGIRRSRRWQSPRAAAQHYRGLVRPSSLVLAIPEVALRETIARASVKARAALSL